MNNPFVSKALLAIFALFTILAFLPSASAQQPLDQAAAEAQAQGWIAVGAGLAVGLAGIGTGVGQSNIGAAAIGATAEDQKLFGKGLTLTVIPETIVIFGLVVSLLLIFVF